MPLKQGKSFSVLGKILAILAIFLLGAGVGYFSHQQKFRSQTTLSQEKEIYLAFLTEVYETIQENYWEKLTDEQLAELFKLGAEKLTGQPQILKAKNKKELWQILEKIFKKEKNKEKKKELVTKLADLVLTNLKPFGRNRLYTKKEERALSQNIKNINPEIDQYQVLEVEKTATQEEIKRAFEEKKQRLEKEKSPQAKEEYKKLKRAYQILSDPVNRRIYDLSGIEPTINYQLLTPKIFYLHIKKFSPTTLDELKRVTEKVDNQENLDTLILDLRDNIGGAIDLLPYFLGPFIGRDQYAYEFFHQNEKTPFKTKTGWLKSLVRYKKVVVLINQGTQSSAELAAATLKKYNVGVLVGEKTKGWGTVEKVFPLSSQLEEGEKYSVFLVHSLALREDGQPIEGNGVEPMININDPSWEKQLYAYFHYPDLIRVVKELFKTD